MCAELCVPVFTSISGLVSAAGCMVWFGMGGEFWEGRGREGRDCLALQKEGGCARFPRLLL